MKTKKGAALKLIVVLIIGLAAFFGIKAFKNKVPSSSTIAVDSTQYNEKVQTEATADQPAGTEVVPATHSKAAATTHVSTTPAPVKKKVVVYESVPPVKKDVITPVKKKKKGGERENLDLNF